MNKSEIFMTLIKACQRKDGSFSLFSQYCKKDPDLYFKKKGLEKEYSSLSKDNKDIFKDSQKFFDLLVEYNFKNNNNVRHQTSNKCKMCGDNVSFVSLGAGYKNTCCSECALSLQKQTVNNFSNSRRQGINEKIKNTFRSKYGVDHFMKTEEGINKIIKIYADKTQEEKQAISNKAKRTKLEKYGDQNYNNRGKATNTCIEKYGVENPSQSDFIKLKKKETVLKKTGFEHISQQHIKDFYNLKNINYIIENYTDQNNRILKQKLLKDHNISNEFYSDHILPALRSMGYVTKTDCNKTESMFLKDISQSFNITLVTQYQIPDTSYKVDGYDPETNTIYEFLGDYWHGNPDVFDLNEMNLVNKKTFKKLNTETFKRFKDIKDLGYKIEYIWESDFKNKGLEGLKEYK